MLVYTTVADLKKYLTVQKQNGLSIGFVPTMGALHSGHMSLVNASLENDISVCSIFVNPKQFNDSGDLKKYPRTIHADIKLLYDEGCDVLFCPTVDQVYPDELDTQLDVDVAHLTAQMEGIFRPGHFEGMLEVVHRLLDIVSPDALYMGQKDYQQFSLVKEMIVQLNMSVELKVCPIVREVDGLAMSSRNIRLTEEYRSLAPSIFRTLHQAKKQLNEGNDHSMVEQRALKDLQSMGFKPEYFEVVTRSSLQKPNETNAQEGLVICVAAWAGEIRLIDNVLV